MAGNDNHFILFFVSYIRPPSFFFVRHRCAACLLPLAVVVVPPAVVPPVADVPPVALLPLAEDKDVRRVARVTPVACPLPRTKT